MASSQPIAAVAPKLVSVSSSDSTTITLRFDRTITAGSGNLVISNGHSQSYVGANGLSSRIVGATDTRTLDDSDGQITYHDDYIEIHLSSALHSGESYSITMDAGTVHDLDSSGAIGRISSTALFNFTASGNVSVPATPAATVGAAIHFIDTGASATDYITAAQEQRLTGSYIGNLGSNEFIQVSLDNGASWHQATANADDHSWSYSGSIVSGNLATGTDGNLNGTLLARVSNTDGGSTATASQAYVYSNHPIEVSVNSTVSFSTDSGSDMTDLMTNVASQTISGIYQGVLQSGQTLQISVDDGTTWLNASASDGSWRASNVTLLEGTHGLQMRVTDAAGNSSGVAENQYTLISSGLALTDRALMLASDSGSSASDGITNNLGSVTLNVANLHGVHVGDVFQVIDTSNGSAVVGSYTIQYGDLYYGSSDYLSTDEHNATARTALNISVDGGLNDGMHNLAVRLVDIAGNVGAASSIAAITLDTVAPAAQIVPSATSFAYTSEVQTITGQYSSATGLLDEVVQVSLDNGASWQTATTANVSTGISSWSVTGAVTNGLIEVRIGDAAGNFANYADSGRNIVVFEANAGTSFDTSSGSAPIFGGTDNNAFNLSEPTHNILSGGAGVDTVTLRFNNNTLPLAKLFGIDVINMSPTYQSTTYGGNTISGITPTNVATIADLIAGGHKLQIDGNDTNIVTLGAGWSADNPSENSGYHTYHATGDNTIVLLIGSAIQVQPSA
jgi:hypothetical protein